MIIKGSRVHNIGYRPLLLGIAESLDIERFSAENLYIDGFEAVEVLVEDDENKVKAFLEIAMKKKPEKADVEKINIEDYLGTVMKTESYYRYLTATQLAKMAEYGGRMIEKQDETIREVKDLRKEFKDYRQEFKDYRQEFKDFADGTKENFKTLEARYGEISEKLGLTLEALRAESSETRRILAEAIGSLKKDSAETREELKRAVDNLARLVEKLIERLSLESSV
ncbi:MAG: acylphosphatase [Candidatus Bathyarchaeia archaeon]